MTHSTVAKDMAYTQEHNHLFTPACLWSLWVIVLFMFPLCNSDFIAVVIFYTKKLFLTLYKCMSVAIPMLMKRDSNAYSIFNFS